MSATKNWIMDLEEKFYDDVVDIIKESDSCSEAMTKAVELGKKDVPFIDSNDVEEIVSMHWNDYWQKFAEMNH